MTMRRRAARMLALAYVACVVWPPLALAFADGAVAAHCLTDDIPAVVSVHVQMDGTVHEHGGAEHKSEHKPAAPDGKGTSGNCCGLFGLNAMAPGVTMPTEPPPRGPTLMAALEAALSGHGPDRIDRPPIVLASL